MVTVAFILVILVQRVCGWAGFGIYLLWLRRLLVLLFLTCCLCLGTLVVAASARLPTRCLGVACHALDSQRIRPCGLREALPFSD